MRPLPPALTALAVATAAAAQSTLPAPAHEEQWRYPIGAHADPVVPPPALYSGEGRARLVVDAIVYDPHTPPNSRAVVRIEGETGSRRVVRRGDQVGRFRVREIRAESLVAEVRSLGSVREEVLLLGSVARTDSAPPS